MNNFFQRRYKGYGGMMLMALLVCLVLGFASTNALQTLSASFAGEAAVRADAKARLIGETKMAIYKETAYKDLTTETKKKYDDNFQTEVVVSAEKEVDGKKQKDITVKVYKTGGTVPVYQLTFAKPVSSSGSGNTIGGSRHFTEIGEFSEEVPSGVTTIYATVIGAGGGGGGSSRYAGAKGSAWHVAGGGGGGAGETILKRKLTVTPGDPINVVIGQGGAGGAGGPVAENSTGGTGSDGGNTTLTVGGITVTAKGGAGGAGGYLSVIRVNGLMWNYIAGVGGSGASGTSLNGISGASGSNGVTIPYKSGTEDESGNSSGTYLTGGGGGPGGNSYMGVGGSANNEGQGYGGGGGGGGVYPTKYGVAGDTGGAGAAGIVILEY